MAACACVAVLCGAPAAGKSSLSRELRRRPARRVGAVHHISFDDIERGAGGSAVRTPAAILHTASSPSTC
jgi:adenylate kinase family enzyme